MSVSVFFLAGFVGVLLIWMCISAALLLLGAKIANIANRSYGQALAATVLSGLITYALAFLLKTSPLLSALLGTVGGLLVTALLMMPIFKTTPGRAFAAAALAAVFTVAAVAPLAMVTAVVLPAFGKAHATAALTQAVSNGHNIYLCAFANQINSSVLGDDGNLPFPKVGQYNTSTEFFIDLVESGRMNVGYDFFAARGIPGAKSTNSADFNAENNAWCVVLGLEDAPDGTPFMFTRNYAPAALQAGDDPIVLTDQPPFGKDGLVVVLKNGAAFYLKNDRLKNSLFNPAQTPSGTNLVILRP